MRRGWVVDASVGAKLFLPEEFSDKAEELFRELVGIRKRFFVPDLFFIECANIFWKHVRRFGLRADEAQESLQDLRGLALLSVSSTTLLSDALDLALELGISAYDAAYVALAQDLSVPLVTADRKLIRKLEGSGNDVRWLGDLTS
ncbi:MAG TPA: type II toxin-antitoxin system VapC family toxin [Thermoanaerobaculia bacterium]